LRPPAAPRRDALRREAMGVRPFYLVCPRRPILALSISVTADSTLLINPGGTVQCSPESAITVTVFLL
jgi:hypothetical protein